jgi:very-short-patch-repair endonuclease
LKNFTLDKTGRGGLHFLRLTPLIKGVRGIMINYMEYNYLPYDKKLKERARTLRNNMTFSEKKLWYGYLKDCGYPFLRQKPIDNYIVDFYCSKLKLVIEIDGETHITEKDKKYDSKRTKTLEGYGLKVLRFWNDDILKGIEVVSEMIEDEIEKIKSPNPLYQGGVNKL